MASKKDWVVGLVKDVTNCDEPTAVMLVDRLMEEGLLVLGYGNTDVDKVVEKFTETFGTTKVSKQDRFAAHRLAAKYGSQSVCGIIQLLAEHSTERYAPVVGSIVQLETKLVSVLNFLRKLGTESEIVDVG